jgi:hypothetical protein
MININFFDDIYLLRFVILQTEIESDVLYTRVLVNKKVLNYYQKDSTIIITKENHHDGHGNYNKIYSSSPNRHINLFNKNKFNTSYNIRLNGSNLIPDYDFQFIDISRSLKLNKILNKYDIS